MNQCFPVVRECGLMLQGMVSVFLFEGHAFLRICRIRSHVPGPRDMGERNRKPVYRDSWLPVCQSCIPAGIFAIYMADGKRILPWSFLISFSIHLYCISTPFLQPPLKRFSIPPHRHFDRSGAEWRNHPAEWGW